MKGLAAIIALLSAPACMAARPTVDQLQRAFGKDSVKPLTGANLRAAAADPWASKRHIVFMLVDDGGLEYPFWPGGFGKGSVTPELERLANESTIFTQAYTVVSSCSPSRSAILTGMPTHQNGMYGLHNQDTTYSSHYYVRTLPRILSDAGYFTAASGKYHVGPDTSAAHFHQKEQAPPLYFQYPFDFGLLDDEVNSGDMCCSGTEYCLTRVGYNMLARNISYMRSCWSNAMDRAKAADKPLFLYVAWGDAHRCGDGNNPGAIGAFCEHFGDGVTPGQGKIPDWTPRVYNPSDVQVPWHQPDTTAAREEIAAQWTAVNRIDQGVGLLRAELAARGMDPLVLYFSDNGIPFPGAKTQAYWPGMVEPLIVRNPLRRTPGMVVNDTAVVSSLDFAPTMMDWAGLQLPTTQLDGKPLQYTGTSLLPSTGGGGTQRVPGTAFERAFLSHDSHSISHYFPKRAVREAEMALIYNPYSPAPVPILDDVWNSATWAWLEANEGSDLWIRGNVSQYRFRRPVLELFNRTADPTEQHNLADDPAYAPEKARLMGLLFDWMQRTEDPWRNEFISGSVVVDPVVLPSA